MSYAVYAGLNAAANPTIHIDPETGFEPTSGNLSRIVDQTLHGVEFRGLADAKFVNLLPPSGSTGPNAQVYDYTAASPSSYSATSPYDVEAVGATSRSKEFKLSEIGGQFNLLDYTIHTQADQVRPDDVQVRGKRRAIQVLFGEQYIYGDSTNAGEFDGLETLIAAGYGQTMATAGGNQLDEISQLISLLWSNDRRLSNIHLLMNTAAYRKVLNMLYVRGCNPMENFRPCPLFRNPEEQVLHLDGVPILISDHIQTDTGTTTIFAINRKQVIGLCNAANPDIKVRSVQEDRLTGRSWLVSWWVGMASLTGLGLASLTGFTVALT